MEYINILWADSSSLSSLGINMLFKEVKTTHPCLFHLLGTECNYVCQRVSSHCISDMEFSFYNFWTTKC